MVTKRPTPLRLWTSTSQTSEAMDRKKLTALALLDLSKFLTASNIKSCFFNCPKSKHHPQLLISSWAVYHDALNLSKLIPLFQTPANNTQSPTRRSPFTTAFLHLPQWSTLSFWHLQPGAICGWLACIPVIPAGRGWFSDWEAWIRPAQRGLMVLCKQLTNKSEQDQALLYWN